MQLFLLAVIMRQIAILLIALLGYNIYKLWTSETIAKKYTNFGISVFITILIILTTTLITIWFKHNPLDALSDDTILYFLQTKYSLLTIECIIGLATLCYGISIINFDKLFNSGIENLKLASFTLIFISIGGAIGYTAYEQEVQLSIPPQQHSIISGVPGEQPSINQQFFTTSITNYSETVLYTNNQNIGVSLGDKDNLLDVSKPTTYKELQNVLKARGVRLTKGSVVRKVDTNHNATTKETSGLLEQLTDYEQDTLPLQIKITKVSLIDETLTASPKIRPSVAYQTEETKYLYVEYEIINQEEIDSIRDSKTKDTQNIDNLLKGSDKYEHND